jgi:Domain of unknown function (DUF4328)
MTHSADPGRPRPMPTNVDPEPSASMPALAPSWAAASARPGHPLRLAGTVVQLALAAVIVTDVLLTKAVWDRLSLVERTVAHPQTVSLAELQRADHSVHTAGVVAIVAYFVTALIFVAWFFRAWSSANRHNGDVLRFGQGWAIGSWITPILGLWRPYQMTTDILNASELPLDAHDWDRRPYVLLRFWWGFFLLSAIWVRFYSTDSNSLGDFKLDARLEIASSGLEIIAAVLAVLVVGRITAANDRRRTEILGPPTGAG